MNKIFYLLLIVTTISCQKNNNDYQPITTDLEVTAAIEGKKLMETHCYLCHSPSAPENEARIGPPMIAIKTHYLEEYTTKEDFIASIKSFVENPSEDKVHLNGAFNRFGLMPKQSFPAGSIEKIAAYIYDYQIDEPFWFSEHWKGHGNKNWKQTGKKLVTTNQDKSLEEIGLEYALSTKKVLGKNLMETIQNKGTLEALTFCNHQAISLTDSMSLKHNAIIKRVSDKNRNPNNKANAEELKYIAQFKEEIAAKKESKPIVVEKGNKVHFYYPIPTNSMCLQCHGKPDYIKNDVRLKTLKLYPNDLAIGYNDNEIRGIWSITFDKK
jgi:Protein of unknown function (DUF3365)